MVRVSWLVCYEAILYLNDKCCLILGKKRAKKYIRSSQNPMRTETGQIPIKHKKPKRKLTAKQMEALKEHRRIKSREYRQRMQKNPDWVERERIRGRQVAKAYYQRMRLDFDWLERRNAKVRPKWREWYHRPENKERRQQASRERRTIHKIRMLTDPHYAYYQREYENALRREKRGNTDIDPNGPRWLDCCR